jgi:hypothetical protein
MPKEVNQESDSRKTGAMEVKKSQTWEILVAALNPIPISLALFGGTCYSTKASRQDIQQRTGDCI